MRGSGQYLLGPYSQFPSSYHGLGRSYQEFQAELDGPFWLLPLSAQWKLAFPRGYGNLYMDGRLDSCE